VANPKQKHKTEKDSATLLKPLEKKGKAENKAAKKTSCFPRDRESVGKPTKGKNKEKKPLLGEFKILRP